MRDIVKPTITATNQLVDGGSGFIDLPDASSVRIPPSNAIQRGWELVKARVKPGKEQALLIKSIGFLNELAPGSEQIAIIEFAFLFPLADLRPDVLPFFE